MLYQSNPCSDLLTRSSLSGGDCTQVLDMHSHSFIHPQNMSYLCNLACFAFNVMFFTPKPVLISSLLSLSLSLSVSLEIRLNISISVVSKSLSSFRALARTRGTLHLTIWCHPHVFLSVCLCQPVVCPKSGCCRRSSIRGQLCFFYVSSRFIERVFDLSG